MKYLRLFEDFSDKHFIWIHGLPGSGKSHLAKIMNIDNQYEILDDIASFDKIDSLLNAGSDIILTSPYFEEYLKFNGFYNKLINKLNEHKDYILEEIWFENNPNACIENLKSRTKHSIKSEYIIPEIQIYSKDYKVPSNVDVMPIWKNNI